MYNMDRYVCKVQDALHVKIIQKGRRILTTLDLLISLRDKRECKMDALYKSDWIASLYQDRYSLCINIDVFCVLGLTLSA